MIHYDRILQTGIQSLLAVAIGWVCGRWRLVDPEPTVQHTNTLVLRVGIPCLQVWLLAVKTDMRQAENWSALGAFMAWSVGLQALLAAQQLAAHGRLRPARLGVDGLLLTTNNTGILGPVVLEAALGPRYAPLGMLATVVLYFQQLPTAQLLFELEQHRAAAAAASGPGGRGGQRQQQQYERLDDGGPEEEGAEQQREQQAGGAAGGGAGSGSPAGPGGEHASGVPDGRRAQQQQQLQLQPQPQQQPQQQQQQQQRWQHHHQGPGKPSHHHLELHMEDASDPGPSRPGGPGQHKPPASVAALVLTSLAKNPLVWVTAAPLLLSALGSSAVLDPSSPSAVPQVAFLEQLLGWFAQTTAPLTLFTTGLWMHSNAEQRRQRQQRHPLPGGGQPGAQQNEELTWRQLGACLAARATLAPAAMVAIARALGFRGDMAHALVVLTLLPLAQTAFVVCRQYEHGTAAVSHVMVASLFAMLPQLMTLLGLLEWLGTFA